VKWKNAFERRLVLWGLAPKPPGSASPRIWDEMIFSDVGQYFRFFLKRKSSIRSKFYLRNGVFFREAEQRFLLLFLRRRLPNQLTDRMDFREAEQRFLLLFLEKEENTQTNYQMEWPSAKRNNAFCFFFWKKKKTLKPIYHMERTSAKRNNAFCFFFWKKKSILYDEDHDHVTENSREAR
jgi:hypothetical protein